MGLPCCSFFQLLFALYSHHHPLFTWALFYTWPNRSIWSAADTHVTELGKSKSEIGRRIPFLPLYILWRELPVEMTESEPATQKSIWEYHWRRVDCCSVTLEHKHFGWFCGSKAACGQGLPRKTNYRWLASYSGACKDANTCQTDKGTLIHWMLLSRTWESYKHKHIARTNLASPTWNRQSVRNHIRANIGVRNLSVGRHGPAQVPAANTVRTMTLTYTAVV